MKSIITVAILCSVCIFSSCTKHEPSNTGLTPRTILVYMSANNSLGKNHYDRDDINEMIVAAKNNTFNGGRLIVYHHAYGSKQPQLKEITAAGEKILKTYDISHSSADSARMFNVIADAKAAAPAQNYGLVLWSHGSGWLQDGRSAQVSKADVPVMYSFGQDILPGNTSQWMNVSTLAKVLDKQGFDFIYFDCCYMAGVEVAYELRNVTRRIVASATVLMEEGMPYQDNLRWLFMPQANLVNAARNTFNYYNSKTDYQKSCTISVIDCSYMDEIAEFAREAYSTAKPLSVDADIQEYTLDNPCYYYDFKDYVGAISDESSAYNNLCLSLEDAIEYKANTESIWSKLKIKRHSGLSTYILKNKDDNPYGYKELAWWRDVAHVLYN